MMVIHYRWVKVVVGILAALLVTSCDTRTSIGAEERLVDPTSSPPSVTITYGPAGTNAPTTLATTTSHLATPADACAVMPSQLAAELGLAKPEPQDGGTGSGCKWIMGNDKQHRRYVYLDYSTARDEATQKNHYDRLKQTDMRSGRGLGAQVSDRGEMTHIGSKAKGTDFDEGYYFYGIEEVVAGLKHGTGTVVLRKINATVTITYRGGQVASRSNGRVHTNPDPTETAKQILDKVADPAIAAIQPT